MPFKKTDVESHKKGLSDHQKTIWVKTANAILRECIKAGGSDKSCSPQAIKLANNAAAQAKTMSAAESDSLVVELVEEAVREMAVDDLEVHEVRNVEVMAVGTWNGDEFTEDDIDSMVSAFSTLKKSGRLEPFLKISHNAKQTLIAANELPAAGWVSDLRRVGKKLVADLVGVPRAVAELMKVGGYKNRSCEVFFDYKDPSTGQVFPRVLKAIALLGAEVPAVNTLADILAWYETEGLAVKFGDEALASRSYIVHGPEEEDEDSLRGTRDSEAKFTTKAWEPVGERYADPELAASVPIAVEAWALRGTSIDKEDLVLSYREPDGTVNVNAVKTCLLKLTEMEGLPEEVKAGAESELRMALERYRVREAAENGAKATEFTLHGRMKKEKTAVKYKEASGGGVDSKRCGACIFLDRPYSGQELDAEDVAFFSCSIVEGTIRSGFVCNLFEAVPDNVRKFTQEGEDDMAPKPKTDEEIQAENKAKDEELATLRIFKKENEEKAEEYVSLKGQVDVLRTQRKKDEVNRFLDEVTSGEKAYILPAQRELLSYLLENADLGSEGAATFAAKEGELDYSAALRKFVKSGRNLAKKFFSEQTHQTDEGDAGEGEEGPGIEEGDSGLEAGSKRLAHMGANSDGSEDGGE